MLYSTLAITLGVCVVDEDRYTIVPDAVDLCAAKAEIERLLADSRFHLTDRNRAFLRYVANEHFAGNAKGAKAYAVAIDVFGRPSSFDPATDPIVRIEAARVRAALDQYYEAYGMAHQLRVSLPRGHYVAEFSIIPEGVVSRPHNERLPPPERLLAIETNPSPVADASERPPSNERSSRWRTFAVGGVALIAAGISLVFGTIHLFAPTKSAPPRFVDKPLVSFIVTTRDPINGERMENLEDDLMVAVSRFGTLRITDNQAAATIQPVAGLAGAYRGLGQDMSDYQVTLKYKVGVNERSVKWAVLEARSGETLASGEENAMTAGRSVDDVDAELVSALALRFGSGLSLLGDLELDRNLAANTIGNVCVLRGEYALSRGRTADIMLARSCLTATLNSSERNADANATLSRVLVAIDEAAGSTAHSAEALTLANNAVSMAPGSDRALAARMVALYANSRPDAAMSAGNDALNANPLNAEVAGAFALRVYASGYWAKGVALARKTVKQPELVSSDAELVLALENYRGSAFKAALRQLDNMVGNETIGAAVRIATLVRMGKQQEAIAALDEAQRLRPQFPKLLAAILETRRFHPSLAAMLLRDLAAAGAQS
jgi:tetratricopeptide (TPR) repeat protein